MWNRRAFPVLIEYLSAGDRAFAQAEFSHALLGALHALTSRWFNSQASIQRASYKAAQLRWAAADKRLRIPESLITSNESDARAFLNSQHRSKSKRFVAKPLYRPVIQLDQGYEAIHTTFVDERILENLSDLRTAPCIFQEFIPRKYDVRVNVVGDEVFGTKMDSSHLPEAEADSRLASDYRKIVHSALPDLPQGIAQACRDMCACFGLRFGAFDFAVDRNEDWFFLEVNPNGQWYWIEEMTGQPLSAAMAREIRRQLNTAG